MITTPMSPDDSTAAVVGKGAPTVHTRGSGQRSTDLLKDNDGWIDGKFRLMEKLGEGGFGLVYKAEQTQPIHRFVAVKILKAGMDTQQVIARFATERQSLALMEHPNIARVLDAGETERGQPYFVMEMVRGNSITKYAKQKELTLNQRIELFIPVCHAVNHAHQKGIIHRDLKPSNVMVMEEDGVPMPKVIDFGIAKVLEQKDISQTLATGMDQLVGTPGYISPEQIEHGSSHVDTRSDVYALGSILMELLTGKALISPMDIAQKPLHQILRDQVERDPPRPSSREAALKGDLDWIILKALERDPERRYGNADDLANDLRRFLNHQPVSACPPSRRYLLEKFVRRHRVAVAASVAISLAVLIGAIVSTALYFQSEENRRQALQGREELRKSYSRSDAQMARQLTERTDYTEAVAWLCRALRTDPENQLATTQLLSLLAHVHLPHPITPEMPLPVGAREARLVALSRESTSVVAISSVQTEAETQDVLSQWDTHTHQRIDHPLPAGIRCTGLDMTRDGQHIILSRDDGLVEMRAIRDGSPLTLEPRMDGSILSLTVSGDGQTLAVGGEKGIVHVWDLRQPARPARVLRPIGAELPVDVLALDYLGTVAAGASLVEPVNPQGEQRPHGIATVWDLSTGLALGEPFEAEAPIAALALNRRREILAVGLQNGVVNVANYREQSELLSPLIHPSAVICLSISVDGLTLTVGDGNDRFGYLHDWDLATGRPRTPAQVHDGAIVTASQSPEQGLITSVSRHGELQVWDTRTGERNQQRLRHSVSQVSVTPNATQLVLAPHGEAFVQVWSIHQRMTTPHRLTDEEIKALPSSPTLVQPAFLRAPPRGTSPDGRFVASADAEGKVTVFESATGDPLGPTFQHPPAVGPIALSLDGRLAVTSGRDQEVRLWDIATGTGRGIALRHETFVTSLALSSDSQKLVTVTEDGAIRLWDTRTGDSLTPSIRQGPDIRQVRVADHDTQILYQNAEGWFSLPMPPPPTVLPTWFLDLAESLARRRLSPEGKIENLTLTEERAAIARIPTRIRDSEKTAQRWASWLLADPEGREGFGLQ